MGGNPMTTPAEYREIAEDCLRVMRSTTSPDVRRELGRLAHQWNELADELERRHRMQVANQRYLKSPHPPIDLWRGT